MGSTRSSLQRSDSSLRFKWNELLKLKFLPKESPKGFKAQIEWYMNLENNIRGIIDVGKRDAELATEAFGRSKINTILNMFPLKLRSQRFVNRFPNP